MDNKSTVDTLITRIEKLEGAVQRSRMTTIGLLIAFIAVASVATVTAQSAATQTTQHLKIVDANGVTRVDIDKDGIALAGTSGNYREVIGVDAKTNIPFLEMRAEDSSVRVGISGDPTGPYIRMRDGHGTERVYLGMTSGGTSLLEFKSAANKDQMILEGAKRSPYLTMFDEGTKKFYAGVYDDSFTGGVHTYNADGTSHWYSP